MNKPIDEMILTFWSRSANEAFSRAAAASFFARLDPLVEELSEVKTAVSEAVTNCIVHAYRDTLGKIRMTARIYEDSQIYIQIKDYGCGIADIPKAMEPLFTTCTTGERAGLGFAVMESFMDKVTVHSIPGKGTTVTLRRKFSSKAPNEAKPS